MPNSCANSRICLTCSADLMSLFGAKWSGTSAIFDLSNTSLTPTSRTASIAIGAVTSLASARSTLARISSPAVTFSFPAWRARIFSVSVMPIFCPFLVFFGFILAPSPQGVHQFADRPREDVAGDDEEDHDLRLGQEQQHRENE